MIIENLIKVRYKSRPNRFTVEFIDEKNNVQLAHLHDPGRLKELLIENTEILVKYVSTYKKTNRKTKYDFIGVLYENNWVLLNSSFHNKLIEELIIDKKIESLEEYSVKKTEYTCGNSRFDFLLANSKDEKLILEVKGCTLVVNNIAKFPDAPTIRGTKHINELIKLKNKKNKTAVVILILQNSAKRFMPNYDTDPSFSKALKTAYKLNIPIYPVHISTNVDKNTMFLEYSQILPLSL